MGADLSRDRLVFHSRIRNDPLVKKLNAEQTIRDVRELITSYFQLGNKYMFYYDKVMADIINDDEDTIYEIIDSYGKKVKEVRRTDVAEEEIADLIDFVDVLCQPFKIDSEDIDDIAYYAGIDLAKRDEKNRKAKRKNPLEDRVNEIESDYREMLDNYSYRVGDFDDSTEHCLELLSIPEVTEHAKIKSIKKIIESSLEYLNRSYALLRLADYKNSILEFEKTFHPKGTMIFRKTERDGIRKSAALLRQQAKINELRFKQLFSYIWNDGGTEDPEKYVEERYQKTLEGYKLAKWFELSPEDVDDFINKTLVNYATPQTS